MLRSRLILAIAVATTVPGAGMGAADNYSGHLSIYGSGPLAGARVRLLVAGDTTITDPGGYWAFSARAGGESNGSRNGMEILFSGRSMVARASGRDALGKSRQESLSRIPDGRLAKRAMGTVPEYSDTLDFSAPGFESLLVPVASPPAVVDTFLVRVDPPKLRRIPAGGFTMGSSSGSGNSPHRVVLSEFYIDSTEVTRAAFSALMGRDPSASSPATCTTCPVESVTWYDALRFCNARSRAEGRRPAYDLSDPDSTRWTWIRGSAGYRLPTEAEWEYAARGGATTDWYWGTMIGVGTVSQYAWYSLDAGGTTHPVAGLQPNAYGLFDVAGNTWEWVWDWYNANYSASDSTNPRGPVDDQSMVHKVLRGGSFTSINTDLTQARRIHALPYTVYGDIGFRCVIGGAGN